MEHSDETTTPGMDLEISLPPTADTIAPVFVTSPCNHSGGALLQRAVCESQNGFCYGDNLFDEIVSQVDWAVGLIRRHQDQKEMEAEILGNALAREPALWMPELAPDFDLYMSSLFSSVYNLPFSAQDFALKHDRDVWMVARASLSAARINDLLAMFPRAKFIIIYRNPLDIVRDALRDYPETGTEELCELWNLTMRDYLAIQLDRVLKLKYEDATEQTETFIAKIEEFTNVRGLRNDTVSIANEAELDSQYTLEAEREESVKTACHDMLAVYYPELVP